MPLYRTPKGGMCRYIDFGPMMAASTLPASDSKPEVVSETKPGDPGASRWYLCLGGTGNIGARWMGVEVYPDRATAAIRYAQEKATQAPAGMDPVRNLGDDAYAFYLGASTIYKLVVVKANLFILVVPGALAAGLTDSLFWWSLIASLAIAFVVTVPVNRWLIGRGQGHAVIHAYHH